MMGGIDWAAMPVVAEILGIQDIENLIIQLLEIKEFKSRG